MQKYLYIPKASNPRDCFVPRNDNIYLILPNYLLDLLHSFYKCIFFHPLSPFPFPLSPFPFPLSPTSARSLLCRCTWSGLRYVFLGMVSYHVRQITCDMSLRGTKQSQDFEITSLRCRDLRNDKCLTEHDINQILPSLV